MLKRSTLKNLSRLFTHSLAPLLPRKRRTPRAAAPAAKAVKPRKPASRAPVEGRWVPGVAIAPAGRRRYRLFLPLARLPAQRLPLLVMLHGCDQTAARFAASTRMHRIAARAGFAVLFVEQDRAAHAQRCWHWYDTRSGLAQAEAALVLQAVDQVCTLHGADRTRVAIAGLSAGAAMAALVAARYPDRFAAVAMHSGVAPGLADSTLSALAAMAGRRADAPLPALDHPAAPWPALLVIQGGEDRVVAPRNGRRAAEAWAATLGAQPQAMRVVQRGQRHVMHITEYRAGRRSVATLVEIPALGHAWSGGTAQAYSDPQGPDASRLIWAFVRRQFG